MGFLEKCYSMQFGASCDIANEITNWFTEYQCTPTQRKDGNPAGKNEREGIHANIIELSTSSLMKLSGKNQLSSRSPSTTMPIPHKPHQRPKQLQQRPRSLSPLTSTKSIYEVPNCCICLANNHRSTQCPFLAKQICATLFNTREASLPLIWRRPRWSQQITYGNCSQQKNSHSVPSTQRSFRALNQPIPIQQNSPLPNQVIPHATATQPSPKKQMLRIVGH